MTIVSRQTGAQGLSDPEVQMLAGKIAEPTAEALDAYRMRAPLEAAEAARVATAAAQIIFQDLTGRTEDLIEAISQAGGQALLPLASDAEEEAGTSALTLMSPRGVQRHITKKGFRSIFDYGSIATPADTTAAFQAAINSGQEVFVPELPGGAGYVLAEGPTSALIDNGGAQLTFLGKAYFDVMVKSNTNPAPSSKTMLQVNAEDSVYTNVGVKQSHLSAAFQVRVGAVDNRYARHNRFDGWRWNRGNSGLYCYGDHNEFLRFRHAEMWGSCINIDGTAGGGAYNTIHGLRGRNVTTGVGLKYGANHNELLSIWKWCDPARFTLEQQTKIPGMGSRAPWQQYALDGYLGGDVVSHTFDTYKNRSKSLWGRGHRDGYFTMNGDANSLEDSLFEDGVGSAMAWAGTDCRMMNVTIRYTKVGVSFRSAFGGLSRDGVISNVTVEHCWGIAGFEQVGSNATREWMPDEYYDDDPDYIYYNNGSTINTYKANAPGGTRSTGSIPPIHTSNAGNPDGVWDATPAQQAQGRGTRWVWLNSVDSSEDKILPRNHRLIGCHSKGNIRDYLLNSDVPLVMIGCSDSNGTITDAAPMALKPGTTINLRATCVGAGPITLTTDGLMPFYDAGTAAGTGTAFIATSATGLPALSQLIIPTIAVAFPSPNTAIATLDVDGQGPLRLYREDGTPYDAARPVTTGSQQRFIRRTGLHQAAAITGLPADRDGWYNLPSSRLLPSIPGLLTGPSGVALVGTISARDPITFAVKLWDVSALLRRTSSSVGSYVLSDVKITPRVVGAGTEGWAAALEVDTRGTPRVGGLLVKVTAAVGVRTTASLTAS